MIFAMFVLLSGSGARAKRSPAAGGRDFFYLVMFVKDALEEEVGVVVELGAGVWRNFQPAHKDVLNGRHPNHTSLERSSRT